MTITKTCLALMLLSLAACSSSGASGIAYEGAGGIGKGGGDPRVAYSGSTCAPADAQAWAHEPDVCVPNSGR